MFYCEKCGKEWPNNYCPTCARTIERSEIEPIPSEKTNSNKKQLKLFQNEQRAKNAMEEKQRHGCVTAWLILIIISNSLATVIYLFAGDIVAQYLPGGISNSMIILLAVLGIFNIIFSVMLLKWKKWGFWGCIFTAIGAVVINLSIGLGIGQSILGLVGIAILFGILQIKKDNISAWDNLD